MQFAIGYRTEDELKHVMTEKLYWLKKRAIGRPAVEANGLLDDAKSVPDVSTRKQLADWLNKLAHRVHIDRTPTNPKGYLATEDNIG